ncbi:MAG: hypothetical protein KGH66_02445 [Candidatus Micrarchaeota archaeon]|nr:hypothetical protein [Candidatus Micrarchaeota archaeon]
MIDKEKFLKIYANIPANIREEIIVVIDGSTFSWNAAYIEVSGDTEIGRKILLKMHELGFL